MYRKAGKLYLRKEREGREMNREKELEEHLEAWQECVKFWREKYVAEIQGLRKERDEWKAKYEEFDTLREMLDTAKGSNELLRNAIDNLHAKLTQANKRNAKLHDTIGKLEAQLKECDCLRRNGNVLLLDAQAVIRKQEAQLAEAKPKAQEPSDEEVLEYAATETSCFGKSCNGCPNDTDSGT